MEFYQKQRVVVTGGQGFLAPHLARALVAMGAEVILLGRRPLKKPLGEGIRYLQVDLQNRRAAQAAFQGADALFHLAAVGWGFYENLRRQPELLTENLLLNTTVIDAAWRAGVSRMLFTSSAAVYGGSHEIMDDESPLMDEPHGVDALFGWAKRMGELQAQAYHRQHAWPVAIVRPFNPYGPGDDLNPERSHVIPALLCRVLAGESPLQVWGSGRTVRSFIYAEDVVRGMLAALERATDAEPINLGSPELTSVAELVDKVLKACGREGTPVIFDASKPDGAPRRVPTLRRAEERLGLRDYVDLETGLTRTAAWIREALGEVVK